MPRFAGASAQVAIIKRNSELKPRRPHDELVIQTVEEILKEKETRILLPGQLRVKKFYDRKDVQVFVAIFIFLNFFISAVEAQMLASLGKDALDLTEDGNQEVHFFDVCEFFFAYAFLVELVINMYGNFLLPFFTCAWNLFDFFIVIISIMSLYLTKLPGISVLRLFRAFRVIRLFGKVKTMRKMMDSMLRSLPGMSMAFCSLFLIMGIYAIIGVDFWSEKYKDNFGSFLKAILTLLQVMTFDSWSSGIAREMMFESGVIPVIYFITYVFVASIVMINVLIALLLDEFMKHPQEDMQDAQSEAKPPISLMDHTEDWSDPQVLVSSTRSMVEPPAGCVIFLGDSSDASSSEHPYSLNQNLLERGKKRRKKHNLINQAKGPYSDQKWREKVDKNIHTLSCALAMLHTELDRLHLEVDEFVDRLEQIPIICSNLFAPLRVAAMNNSKDKFVGAIR